MNDSQNFLASRDRRHSKASVCATRGALIFVRCWITAEQELQTAGPAVCVPAKQPPEGAEDFSPWRKPWDRQAREKVKTAPEAAKESQ